MENVLNQMFLLFFTIIPGLSSSYSCVIGQQGSMTLRLLLWISSAECFPTGTVQNPNVGAPAPGWTTALQQQNCQLDPSELPVGRATQLYAKSSEHSCIVKSLMVHWRTVWCPPPAPHFPFVNNVSTQRLGFNLMTPLGFSCCSSFHLNLMQTSGLFRWHPAGTCPSCTECRQRIRNTGVQERSVFSE